jgi:hypothetical protein
MEEAARERKFLMDSTHDSVIAPALVAHTDLKFHEEEMVEVNHILERWVEFVENTSY